MVCPAVVKDPHLGEGDVYYGDGGHEEVYGVDGAFGVMVEVPAEDRQGPFLRAPVVGENAVLRGREVQVVPQRVFILVGMPVWWSIQHGHVLRARCADWRRIVATSRTSGEWFWVMR